LPKAFRQSTYNGYIKTDKKVRGKGMNSIQTFAAVLFDFLVGVEAYLCNELNPLIHLTSKHVDLISVNLSSLAKL